MVFLSPRDVLPGEQSLEPQGEQSKGVRARELCQAWVRTPEQCPSELWEQIEPVLEMLARQSDEWGPRIEVSPRVMLALRRYLANTPGVLPAAKAVDFAFQQRILPVLRGRGPMFAARIAAIEKKLTDLGMDRSARHVQEAMSLASSQFGDIDFFAY
jgi:hypothetical protein